MVRGKETLRVIYYCIIRLTQINGRVMMEDDFAIRALALSRKSFNVVVVFEASRQDFEAIGEPE